MDDILIFGKDEAEQDRRLEAALRWIQYARVTLNPQKCEFRKTFLDNVIHKNGITPDPEKIEAIQRMSTPTNVSELRRFLGASSIIILVLSQLYMYGLS